MLLFLLKDAGGLPLQRTDGIEFQSSCPNVFMLYKNSVFGVPLGGQSVPDLVFINFQGNFDQMNGFGGLWHVVTLCELREGFFNVVREANVDSFFGGGHGS